MTFESMAQTPIFPTLVSLGPSGSRWIDTDFLEVLDELEIEGVILESPSNSVPVEAVEFLRDAWRDLRVSANAKLSAVSLSLVSIGDEDCTELLSLDDTPSSFS
jgi:hypothetical protein